MILQRPASPVPTLLALIFRLTVRDFRQLRTITSNLFFLVAFFLLQRSGVFVQVLVGVVLLFPMAGDPLQRIPADRLALWPLSRRDRLLLHLGAIGLSPATWIAVALLAGTATIPAAIAVLTVAIGLQFALSGINHLLSRQPRTNLLRRVPALPGSAGELIRKDLRQLLTMLDPYNGLLLMISGVLYRYVAPNPLDGARFGMTVLIISSLSTYTTCLFGRDQPGGWSRYRLVPRRGWVILGAKGAAFLIVLSILVLPLAPICGLTAGFAMLAVGHHFSVFEPLPQMRWTFAGGPSIAIIVLLPILFGAATAAWSYGAICLVPAVLCYAASLAFYGWRLERRMGR